MCQKLDDKQVLVAFGERRFHSAHDHEERLNTL